jgi:hypothetical protein
LGRCEESLVGCDVGRQLRPGLARGTPIFIMDRHNNVPGRSNLADDRHCMKDPRRGHVVPTGLLPSDYVATEQTGKRASSLPVGSIQLSLRLAGAIPSFPKPGE